MSSLADDRCHLALAHVDFGTGIAFVELKKTPVLNRHVLNYAEQHSGESGFLWFDDEVDAWSWSSERGRQMAAC